MPNTSTWIRLATASMAAGLMIFASVDLDQSAEAARRGRRSKNLQVQRISALGELRNASGVPGNAVIEAVFTTKLNPATVNFATFQVRQRNATDTGFTKQIFGDFQVAGRKVRFFPRLPGHLRDPSDPDGGFYPQGTARDNASENAGFQPATGYQVSLLGRETLSPIRSNRGRALRRSASVTFTTADAVNLAELYTTTTYSDSPPPQFSFSNPIDRVPAVADQYATRGGAKDVPNDVAVSLFCTRVPIAPATARIIGNVNLTILGRNGDPGVRRPVNGSVFVEQNFATTLMVFQPQFDLADVGVYALRVKRGVVDLTEQHDFAPNRNRERLRVIFDSLAASRQAAILAGNPNPDPASLADPPSDLIPDWPADAASRGVLKTNLLALGDTFPEEIDPRVMVIFSTRDEPLSESRATIDFLRNDGLYDANLSNGLWDDDVPSAASAILTVSAGSGVDGDLEPTQDVTVNASLFPNHEINWRKVSIPAGVTVQIRGDIPVCIAALSVDIQGTLAADGLQGEKAPGGRKKFNADGDVPSGGAGGPGGGTGGDPDDEYATNTDNTKGTGNTGEPGHDLNGVEALPDDGGRGGEGGGSGNNTTQKSTNYRFGGGGGGGGARLPGSNGRRSQYGGTQSWNGAGGAGGAGSTNFDLDPLVGGAGGGAGGNYSYATRTSWQGSAAAGGGGGGAIKFSTAGVFTVGTTGLIRAQGGRGGNQGSATSTSSMPGGPGGGGGGGSVLLRSTLGFNLANAPAAFDVTGGIGGSSSGTYRGIGGVGGDGYIRLEDPNGAFDVPNGTSGVYAPVGGGVASVVYTKFLDLGVVGLRILNYEDTDISSVTANDAVLIEIQMTSEDPDVFGVPDLTAIDESPSPSIFTAQGTLDPDITSPWLPLKLHDATGGRAFPHLSYDNTIPGNDDEIVFDVAGDLNGKGFRFVRFRIFFQLDNGHTTTDPRPFVEFIITTFQFNF